MLNGAARSLEIFKSKIKSDAKVYEISERIFLLFVLLRKAIFYGTAGKKDFK